MYPTGWVALPTTVCSCSVLYGPSHQLKSVCLIPRPLPGLRPCLLLSGSQHQDVRSCGCLGEAPRPSQILSLLTYHWSPFLCYLPASLCSEGFLLLPLKGTGVMVSIANLTGSGTTRGDKSLDMATRWVLD